MLKISGLVKLFLVSIFLGSCVSGQKEGGVAPFFDRKVQLTPFFKDFPYSGFRVSLKANRVFYFHEGNKKILKSLSLDEAKKGNFAEGRKLSDLDFSKRTFWNLTYNPNNDSLYWIGDEDNTEVTNLYQMDLKTLKIKVLTKVRYTYDYRFNKDFTKVVYAVRTTDGTKAQSEVRTLNLKTGKVKVITKDNPKLKFYWGKPSWSPDESAVIVHAIYGNDRNRRQLVHVNIKTGLKKPLLKGNKKRVNVSVVKNWIGPSEFLYTSDEKGPINVFTMNLKTKKVSQVTRLKSDATSIHYQNKKLFFVERTPVRSKMILMSQSKKSFKKTYEKDFYGLVSIADTLDTGEVVISSSAYNKKVHFAVAKIKSGEMLNPKPIVQVSSSLTKKLVHTAKVDDVEYETFDFDPKTKKKRKIRALLYHPINPLKGQRKMAMIKSFYGYRNRYSTEIQVLQAAGIYVLTPAPRGASGLGLEYSALNDRDLGGNEIIDIIYAGKFLQKHLKIHPSHMGVFGRSHGGYATFRLMTFPGQVNGNKADFPWGFGIAESGFSDIEHFYRNCNIPTWVIKEAGDPDKEPAKMKSRSPLYNTQHFRGRLLVIHGENDNRVPVEGSRSIVNKLKKLAPSQVVYREWPGQGHAIKGTENKIEAYMTRLRFLEESVQVKDL